MLLLTSTSDKIQIVTGGTANIDVHASFADYDSSISAANDRVSVGRKNTKISTATTTDVVLSPGNATTARNVKTLEIANIHASASNQVTIQHTDGTNVIQLESINLLAGERIAMREGVPMRVIDAAGMEKINPAIVAGQLPLYRLPADVSNSTTTAAKLTGLDAVVGVGTWLFEYFILYQAAATTTGVKFSVNHTGTVTSFVYDLYGLSADTTATATQSALMDQDVLTTTGGLFEVWGARAKTTAAAVGPTSGVDTANADMFLMITGLAVVTVTGNIELYHASEVAAASTVKAGTALRLTKVA